MNAKNFLEDCKSDWVKSLGTSEKILLANLMERYASQIQNKVVSMEGKNGATISFVPCPLFDELHSDCVETIIQREAESLHRSLNNLGVKRMGIQVSGGIASGDITTYSSKQKKYIPSQEWLKESEEKYYAYLSSIREAAASLNKKRGDDVLPK